MKTLVHHVTRRSASQAHQFCEAGSCSTCSSEENFRGDLKSICEWRKAEERLKNSKTTKFRLQGGGRKAKFSALEEKLLLFYQDRRLFKLLVSRTWLQQKARELFEEMLRDGINNADETFSSCNGWLDCFMKRHGLSLRRSTTQCQMPPSNYVPKIVDFVLYIREMIRKKAIVLSAVYACDETAIRLGAATSSTVCETGARKVSIRTTGHDKIRIAVLLCAKADGFKLKPYILLPRKRSRPDLVKKYGHQAV